MHCSRLPSFTIRRTDDWHLHLRDGAMLRDIVYCLPVAKRERHRLALRQAATSGDPRFFFGTDSAPHADKLKETACGCAGMFTAINTMSCLAHVFEEEEVLDRLEGFTSLHGPAFYRLPANEVRIRLVKSEKALNFPQKVVIGSGPVTVFDPGFRLFWRVEEDVTRELDSSKLSDNKDGLDVSARIP